MKPCNGTSKMSLSLTKKQKVFLSIYPVVHIILAVILLFFGFSICLDPGEDAACQEQGTLIGLFRKVSMALAGILMAPGIALERALSTLSGTRISGVVDYFFIFLSGCLYAIVFLIIYKIFTKEWRK